MEIIAWRDPNVIPIAAFYGDDVKVNFAGKLATDTQPSVRGCGGEGHNSKAHAHMPGNIAGGHSPRDRRSGALPQLSPCS